jgi:hypothetical protein
MYNHPYLLQGYAAERQRDRQAAAQRSTLVHRAKEVRPPGDRRRVWLRPFDLLGRLMRRRAATA